MNKTIKIFSVLLIAVLLIATLTQVSLANSYTEIINSVDSSEETVDMGDLQSKAGKLVKALRNISAIIAIVVITILGIKYMIGSTEEKAGYKKSFIPLIVGIIVVVAAASIATAMFNLAA